MSKFKKDFNKEQMYKKIMPTSLLQKRENISPIAQTIPASAELSPKSDVPADAATLNSSDSSFLFRNLIEDLVYDKIEYTMKMLRCCTCERCYKDVLALALNTLPPVYKVVPNTPEGREKKLSGEYEVKVTASLIKAVQLVKEQPRHE